MNDLGIQTIYFAKSDLKNAFRIIGIRPNQRYLLILKARDPIMKKWCYFVDKCLPFGSSICCSHFQRFSNALRATVEYLLSRIRRTLITNYLDDFLFIYCMRNGCNEIVIIFLKVCSDINFPVAIDKTEWAEPTMVFLGMLLDGVTFTLAIPLEKRDEALHMVQKFKDKRKATVQEIQKLAGHLNFINRAVIPG